MIFELFVYLIISFIILNDVTNSSLLNHIDVVDVRSLDYLTTLYQLRKSYRVDFYTGG
jgi:two-component SAPR family response regulator